MLYKDLTQEQKNKLFRNRYIGDGADDEIAYDCLVRFGSEGVNKTLAEVFGYSDDMDITEEELE